MADPDNLQIEALCIREWLLIFEERSTWRFARFVPGRFKHVSAMGYSAIAKTWIIYDVTLKGTMLMAWPSGDIVTKYLSIKMERGVVVRMPRSDISNDGAAWRLGFWCVTAMRHLVGLPNCAFLPDTLLRLCLIHGGEVLDGRGFGIDDGRLGSAEGGGC